VVTEIMAGSGLDWLLIDMEHAPNGLESVLVQLQVLAGYPVTAVVRVPEGSPVIIKQVLELGAQNLMVPMISTPEQAVEISQAAQYPPAGIRGVGAPMARSARWNRVGDYLSRAAGQVSVYVQIETAEGVANAREIAAVPGIDGVLVGPADLAASMGMIGEHDHPEVLTAVRQVFAEVRAAGKSVGVNSFEPGAARDFAAAGAAFVLVGADVLLIAAASDQLASDFIANP